MFRRSDINQRLPRFREALASIEDTRKRGGFEGVSPSVLARLEGMGPVGLDSKRHLVLPRNHKLEDGSPLLMLLPGENEQPITLKPDSAALKAAQRLVALSGIEVTVPPEIFHRQINIKQGHAWVNHTTFTITPNAKDEDAYAMYVPRLTFVDSSMTSDMLGSSLAHEADHWDFFFDEAPKLQSVPNNRYSDDQLLAATEKRAYRLTYQIENNMGSYAGLDSVDVLAESYAGIAPADANTMYDDLVKRREAAGIERKITAPLAALAIEHLFGAPDQLATDDEITALKVTDLI